MRKTMKDLIAALLIISAVCLMSACGSAAESKGDKPSVVCTGFAQYDWVRSIIGEQAGEWDIIRLNEKGADMHSFQPSAEDIITITDADLFIYTGGFSESWAEDILSPKKGFKGKAYCLLKHRETVAEDEAFICDESESHESHDSHSDEYDEHIWLSPKRAINFCEDITEEICTIDPAGSEIYRENCSAYVEKLEAMDQEYRQVISEAPEKTLIFADRFPFRYLAEDYGLTCYAAFPGCSAETEASFETIAFLSDKLKKSGLSAVLVTEGSDKSIAETVVKNSGLKDIHILTINSMQSPAENSDGLTYMNVMDYNLGVLKIALEWGYK